jgi:hypothetical protein
MLTGVQRRWGEPIPRLPNKHGDNAQYGNGRQQSSWQPHPYAQPVFPETIYLSQTSRISKQGSN